MQQLGGGGGGIGEAMAIGLRGSGGKRGGSGELIRSLLDEVRPGDLITSDFMRRLLQGLAGLEDVLGQLDDSVGIGKVPDVVFLQLPRALTMLRANEPSLDIEGVYDTFGNRVAIGEANLKAETRGERIVLAQFPVPGAKITGDKSVKLLVSTETNKWLGALDVLMDKGPELWDFVQTRRRPVNPNERMGGASSPNVGGAGPAAEPATAASSQTTTAPADAVAAKTATKAATKSRARRKPATPADG